MPTIFKSNFPDAKIPEDISLPNLILREISQHPADKVAIQDGPSGFSLTYGQLKQYIFVVARNLYDNFEFRKGKVVAIMLPNHPLWAVLFHAVGIVGTATTLNPLLSAEEIRKQIDDCKPEIFVTLPLFQEKVHEAVQGSSVKHLLLLRPKEQGQEPISIPDGASYQAHDMISNLLKPPKTADPLDIPVNPKEDVVGLFYSSGTTGQMKGVKLSHYNLVANLYQTASVEKITFDDILVGILPYFHIFGFIVVLNLALMKGSTIISFPKFDFVEFLTTVQKHKVTRAHVVPPIVVALAKHPVVDKFDLSSLKFLLSGAAPLSKEIAEMAEARLKGTLLRAGYGMTELSPVVSVVPETGGPKASSGVLISNSELRIVDTESGKDLNVNETGEIVYRGPNVCLGYLHNEEATKNLIREDGWVFTGDIGYIDEEGNLYIVDRLKELIKCSGYQVPPFELEKLLLKHDAVAQCAVIGIPDEQKGEIPRAYVVLKEGKEISAQELMDYVAEHVAPYKKVREIEFTKEIPISASGKILRRILKQQALEKLKQE